jgi:MFS family permease
MLLHPPLPLLIVVTVLPAAISDQIGPLLVTVRHERIPAELRGRVFSTFSAIASSASPIGMIVFGYLIESSGLSISIFVIGLGELLAGIVLLFLSWLKDLNQTRPGIDRQSLVEPATKVSG